MTELIDYDILRMIWWGLLGVLLAGFAVMDGFDLGVGMLLPFVARSDSERRMAIHAIEPVWEGNQVWLILGAGAIFAAFPFVYAAAFSGFYFAMFLALVALIVRPCGFAFRNKIADTRWRKTWDWALFVAGFVPALVFGVAVGNLFLGVPFHFDEDLRLFYTGSLWGLFTPFPLLCGLLSVSMLAMHGGVYLAGKTEEKLHDRAKLSVLIAALITVVLFAVGGFMVDQLEGYVLVAGQYVTDGPSNPLMKNVVRESGSWLTAYRSCAFALIVPALGIFGPIGAALLLSRGKEKLAFLSSALGVAGIVATAGCALFPFLMPSSSHPKASLTIWDSSSSQTTLFLMLVVTIFVFPVVLAYTGMAFRIMRGKVTDETEGY